MELEFPVQINSGISTDPEVRWWYVYTAEEVERKGSTVVRYLILLVFSRPYTLECTQQALVSGASVTPAYCTVRNWSEFLFGNLVIWDKVAKLKSPSILNSTLSADRLAILYMYQGKTDLYLRPDLASFNPIVILSLLISLLLNVHTSPYHA